MAGVLCCAGAGWLAAQAKPLVLAPVKTGHAVLRQDDRVTRLEVSVPGSTLERIALTHPGTYPQGRNAPFGARVVGELPGKVLVFTDSFASNPGNIQGECGASITGERFLHVVSLAPPGRETLSVPVESCLADIEPARGMPVWDASKRTLIIRYEHNEGGSPRVVYKVAEDGAVTKSP